MEQINFSSPLEERLFAAPLFENLPLNLRKSILERLNYTVYSYKKGEILARQNSICKRLMVLLEGKLRVDIIDAFGNEVLIETIKPPRAFATPHLFNKNNILPATFTVTEDAILFTATKESVFSLISEEPQLLKSFLCVTGNCTRCTTTRLNVLSRKSLRSRIITYLLETKESDKETVTMEHNQVQLADYLCVTRPALSKELNKMVKEGLIEIKGKIVMLRNLPELERALL